MFNLELNWHWRKQRERERDRAERKKERERVRKIAFTHLLQRQYFYMSLTEDL